LLFVAVEYTVEVDLIVVVAVTGSGCTVVTEVVAWPLTVLNTVVVDADKVVVIVVNLLALLTDVTVCTGSVVTLVEDTIL
jgi:hypothetical protein